MDHDDDLVLQIAAGDEDAMAELVVRWEHPLQGFLRHMLGSVEEAQDLAQETFLQVFARARYYRPEGRFRSWLFRIAGNRARSHLRRRQIVRWVSFEPLRHDRPSPPAARTPSWSPGNVKRRSAGPWSGCPGGSARRWSSSDSRG